MSDNNEINLSVSLFQIQKNRINIDAYAVFLFLHQLLGAHGGTRTPTPEGTWTWTMRVYQFRHVGLKIETIQAIFEELSLD